MGGVVVREGRSGYNKHNFFFRLTLNSVSIKLTTNKDRHKISDKFELRPDLINHFGVTCR